MCWNKNILKVNDYITTNGLTRVYKSTLIPTWVPPTTTTTFFGARIPDLWGGEAEETTFCRGSNFQNHAWRRTKISWPRFQRCSCGITPCSLLHLQRFLSSMQHKSTVQIVRRWRGFEAWPSRDFRRGLLKWYPPSLNPPSFHAPLFSLSCLLELSCRALMVKS